jgi:hypothetical protein
MFLAVADAAVGAGLLAVGVGVRIFLRMAELLFGVGVVDGSEDFIEFCKRLIPSGFPVPKSKLVTERRVVIKVLSELPAVGLEFVLRLWL